MNIDRLTPCAALRASEPAADSTQRDTSRAVFSLPAESAGPRSTGGGPRRTEAQRPIHREPAHAHRNVSPRMQGTAARDGQRQDAGVDGSQHAEDVREAPHAPATARERAAHGKKPAEAGGRPGKADVSDPTDRVDAKAPPADDEPDTGDDAVARNDEIDDLVAHTAIGEPILLPYPDIPSPDPILPGADRAFRLASELELLQQGAGIVPGGGAAPLPSPVVFTMMATGALPLDARYPGTTTATATGIASLPVISQDATPGLAPGPALATALMAAGEGAAGSSPVGSIPLPVGAGDPSRSLSVAPLGMDGAAMSMLATADESDSGLDAFAAALSERLGVDAAGLVGPAWGRAPSEALSMRPGIVLPTVAMPTDPDAGFDDAFGSRIVWMAEQRIGSAELRVSPEGAGPIDIRLQIDGHRISAQFTAANADVRQALESGMDRLRDLLGRHGMELAHSEVGGQRQPGNGRSPAQSEAPGNGNDAPAPVTTIAALRSRGLLDEYA